jgi:DNA-binding Lrp family transcriptional regulator
MISDREFIDVAAKGLEIESEPLAPLAKKLGMTVKQTIERLERFIEEGKVRRFAASVRHQPMGYSVNAMVVARTDEENLENVGKTVQSIDAVSHCYHRSHPDGDPWCVYIMMHGRSKGPVDKALERIEQIPGVRGIEILESIKELKKTSLSGVTTSLKDGE